MAGIATVDEALLAMLLLLGPNPLRPTRKVNSHMVRLYQAGLIKRPDKPFKAIAFTESGRKRAARALAALTTADPAPRIGTVQTHGQVVDIARRIYAREISGEDVFRPLRGQISRARESLLIRQVGNEIRKQSDGAMSFGCGQGRHKAEYPVLQPARFRRA